VVDNDGRVDGLMYATLARVYGIGDKLFATDMFWATSERASPADALLLMKNMIGWAKTCPLVIEVRCGVTAVINDRPEVTGRLLKRMGMQDYGSIHRLDLSGEKQCRASSAESQRSSVPSALERLH
jgi:hypothetical protein